MSQIAFWFGLGGRVPTYEESYCLHLNVPDVGNRESFRQFNVQLAAGPNGSLPPEWLDAAVPNPIEAFKWKNWDLRRSFR